MVKIHFGCNDLNVDVDGKTVDEVMASLKGTLELAGNETARLVGGGTIGGDFVLSDGQEVEFVKPAGEKG